MPATDELLLPYQQRWVADHSPVKVCEKGRRIGITWATAADAVIDAASQNGSDWWYTAQDDTQAKEFMLDVRWWIDKLGSVASIGDEMMDDVDKQVLVHVARFNSGHKIHALSSRPATVRGKDGHVVCDEYAHHPNPLAILKAAMSVRVWGKRVIVISTDNGLDSDFESLLDEIRSGKKSYSYHRITFDDAIAEGLYDRICLMQGLEATDEGRTEWRQEIIDDHGMFADEELFCIPTGSGGTYLSRPIIEGCMYDAPVFRLDLPDSFTKQSESDRKAHVTAWLRTHLSLPLRQLDRNQLHALGEDFGRNSDITVLCPLAVEQKLSRRCPFIIELRNVPFQQQEQVVMYLLDGLPKLMAAKFDAGGNGQALAEAAVLKYGEDKIEAVHLTERRYGEMLPPLRAAFEDRKILIPRDADILSDLRQFQLIHGVPKLPKNRVVSKLDRKPRHGDAGVAIALAYDASRAEVSDIAYTPVRPRGMWAGEGGAL
jgi:phage FluMu gp28-like protein